MSFSGLKSTSASLSLAPAVCRKDLLHHGTAPFHAQVIQCQGASKSKVAAAPLKIARRDILLTALTTASLIAGPRNEAEARVIKPEIRRKIREKLDMLREKAGLGPKRKEEETVPPSKTEEKKLLVPPLPLPLPTSPDLSNGPLVETTMQANEGLLK